MKWSSKDIQVYQKEKTYIDTVLIPLMPLAFQKEQTKAVLASEYIESISMELERMYQGRILLSLPFTYYSGEKRRKSESIRIVDRGLERRWSKTYIIINE